MDMKFIRRYIRQVFHETKLLFRERQFKGLLLFVILLLALGTIFYTNIEHWSMLNSVYFCVITLTTVGYGDYTPHTDTGKIFTIFYVIIGAGILLGFINVIASHATRRYIRRSEAYMARTEEFIERIVDKALEKRNHL